MGPHLGVVLELFELGARYLDDLGRKFVLAL